MRQIRCRLYKGINTKEPDASLRFGAAQSKSPGQGPPATPPGTETRTQHSPHRATAGGPGTRPSRLGMGDPLTVHRAPQQLLHMPCHVHGVIQVEVSLGVQHGVGAAGGRG